MTNDPAVSSTATPMSLDPAFPPSLAEFADASQSAPVSAASALDVARHHAFTGELTFFVDPLVRVYLDAGVAYYAEVVGGQTIGELLLASAVLDARQLEQGVVRVGEVEHLGRLFDRVDDVDRDLAMVVVEHHVDQLVNQLAERVMSRLSISAYRHHASGVHRWFVAPIDSAESQRPVSEVAQVDRSVVDDLPELAPNSTEVRIEWTEPLPADAPAPAPSSDEVQAEVDGFDADVADWAAAAPTVEVHPAPIIGQVTEPPAEPLTGPLTDEASADSVAEFHIVWPDGTQDAQLIPEAATDVPDADAVHDAAPAPDAAPAHGAPPAIDLGLSPAVVEEIPDPDAAIPDDVAAAVKRALQAIDEASSQPIVIPRMELSPILLPQIDTLAPIPDDDPVAAPSPQPAQAQPQPQPMGFAPPTVAMRAEAIYERQASELAAQRAAAQQADVPTPTAAPEAAAAPAPAAAPATDAAPGAGPAPTAEPIASADPAGDAPAASANDRSGALRRLIGSLRKQDND